MADIVERLRLLAAIDNCQASLEAAAEIERLRAGGCARDQGTTQYCAEAAKLAAENERLRAALRKIEREWDIPIEDTAKGWRTLARFMWENARAALEGK